MTKELARVYVIVVGMLAFFLAWVAVAAHPWAPRPAQDPRLAVLAARQHQVQVDSIRVKRLVDLRWAAYRHRLAIHNNAVAAQRAAAQTQQITARSTVAAQPYVAAQPAVRVVNLPALVVTRTS
jgi:hypothetical protein